MQEGGEGYRREGGRERKEGKEGRREGGEGCGRERGREERDVGGREGRRREELVASTCSVSNLVPMPLCSQLPSTHRMVLALCSLQCVFPADLVDSCSLNYKNYINTCS